MPAPLLRLMIRLPPAAIIVGTTARVIRKGPRTFVTTTDHHWSASASHNGTSSSIDPALLTSTSILPQADRTASTAARTATSSVTSAGLAITAGWPSDLISPATRSAADPSRASRHTAYPSPASARTIISPMPRDAPVTTATRPGSAPDAGKNSENDSGTGHLRLRAGPRPQRQQLSRSPDLENR